MDVIGKHAAVADDVIAARLMKISRVSANERSVGASNLHRRAAFGLIDGLLEELANPFSFTDRFLLCPLIWLAKQLVVEQSNLALEV